MQTKIIDKKLLGNLKLVVLWAAVLHMHRINKLHLRQCMYESLVGECGRHVQTENEWPNGQDFWWCGQAVGRD